MYRLAIALLAVLLLAVPAYAAPTEATGSFAYSDSDTLTTWTAGINVDFPLSDGGTFQIGPSVLFNHVDLNDGSPNLETQSLGGRLTWNLTGRDGLFIAASALFNDGDVNANYTVVPEVGLKFGGDGGLVRISISKPYLIDDETEKPIDLETVQATIALGLRF